MKLVRGLKQLTKKDWLIIFFELLGLATLIGIGVFIWWVIDGYSNWDWF